MWMLTPAGLFNSSLFPIIDIIGIIGVGRIPGAFGLENRIWDFFCDHCGNRVLSECCYAQVIAVAAFS